MKLKLQEQPFQILSALLERPGELVLREELIRRLWPEGNFGDFDHGLNKAINKLREVLGDSAETPRFIETLARRGYRFIAPVNGGIGELRPSPESSRLATSHRLVRASLYAMGVSVLAILCFAFVWYAWVPSGHGPAMTQRIVTANPPENPVLEAVVSPSGRFLLYSDENGLFLRTVESDEVRAFPSTHHFLAQSWFPNEDRILALRRTNSGANELWAIRVLDGTTRKLSEDVCWATVSPDGSRIAAMTGNGPGRDIWIFGADGEDAHRIVGGKSWTTYLNVAWAPNSKRLAYIRHSYAPDKTEVTIETVDLAGAQSSAAYSNPGLTQSGDSGLWWLPDGRLIFMLHEEPPKANDSNLWALPMNSATGKPSGHPARLTNLVGFSFDRLSASSNGKRFGFLLWRGFSPIFIGELAGNGTRLRTPQRFTDDNWDNFPSGWTPDGKALLFFSIRGGRVRTYRREIGQTNPEELVADVVNFAESWPETILKGTGMLYWVARSPSHTAPVDLMRATFSGGAPQRLLEVTSDTKYHCAVRAPRCVLQEHSDSGGKRQLVFSSLDPMQGKRTELVRMVDEPTFSQDWSLSPEGARIAYVGLNNHIRILELSDGAIRDLDVKGWAYLQTVTWAADGQSLFASAYSPVWNSALLRVDLRGYTISLLKNAHAFLGDPRASPDGRYLAFMEFRGESNAGILENF